MAKNAQEREGREIWKERGGRERGRANVGWNQTRMGVPLHTTRVTHTYCRCTNKRINYPFTRLWPCVCTFTLCLPKAPRMGFWLAPCVYTYHVMLSKTEIEDRNRFPPRRPAPLLPFQLVVLKLAALEDRIALSLC